MTHRTHPAEQHTGAVTLEGLVTSVACPTCHVAAGSRCITRSRKPATTPHSRRYDDLEQAAGITQNRAERRLAANGHSYGIDRQAEAGLLAAYATRIAHTAGGTR
ncbi:hypothetical protein [Streptomyces sp. NPDC002467]|uniref:zinc finger domain-containing protein n=1 Tax=Streptomyces sp. NPDC002467 TaxID=3364647 RepID=UPI0036B451C0